MMSCCEYHSTTDCQQGQFCPARFCTCAPMPDLTDRRLSAVRIALLVYAVLALAYFFAS